MNAVILIPARYQSSRYPGKPLVELKGATGTAKPLIQRSVEAARRVRGVSGVFVVTDDEGIAHACAPAKVGVIMTSPECRNGTERCAEALAQLHDPDLVINFQGDALLTPPGFVEALIARMEDDRDALVATPAMRMRSDDVRVLQAEEAAGRVGGTTVVTNVLGHALYFSKRIIPHLPGGALSREMAPVRLHVGVYAYRPDALQRYAATPVSELEALEGLEQLRFLVAGISVAVVDVETPPYALRELNNPEDVAPIEQALAEAGLE
ncbi:3-deoxy-manno-octulosonate cytidylyltransferase [Sphingomonas segetis]|jgi:3-deoxy-manno-octulosonate cytidylyltransferase (CMP-KDO synthetase)|uniref:3-deoxy-manno-octulosonate cytidylyltransferase n=1 Tax=Sphingomonas segetis TaxID=1104779 RepID=UPI0012D2FAC6|nr:manno-octulosonate cytidylyltransferase [Sphingomonas segetis]